MNLVNVEGYIGRFKNARVAVVGDMVVDIYVYGKPYRLSREAPVVVIKHQSEEMLPGSAANTVNNLCKLGARVYPVGVIGDDKAGSDLVEYFRNEQNVETDGLFRDDSRPTYTKTRILAGDSHVSKQQVVRIDRDDYLPLSPELESKVVTYIEKLRHCVDAFIISDYGYEMMSDAVIDTVRDIARKQIVVVDSRNRLRHFKGVTLLTPNEPEAEDFIGMKIETEADVRTAGAALREQLQPKYLIITRGNQGMVYFDEHGDMRRIPIYGSDEVTDVTGAGDTVAGVATLGLVGGTSSYESACLANYAAGIVVMKRGTATLTQGELIEATRKDADESSSRLGETSEDIAPCSERG